MTRLKPLQFNVSDRMCLQASYTSSRVFFQIPCNNVTVNILTLKWGVKYGPEYVNRLFAGVKAKLATRFSFSVFYGQR